jgi:hypothetical protein
VVVQNGLLPNVDFDWPKAVVDPKLEDWALEAPKAGVLATPNEGVAEAPNARVVGAPNAGVLEAPNAGVLEETNMGLLEAPNAPPYLTTGVLNAPNAILVLPNAGNVVELKVGVFIPSKAGVVTIKTGMIIAGLPEISNYNIKSYLLLLAVRTRRILEF